MDGLSSFTVSFWAKANEVPHTQIFLSVANSSSDNHVTLYTGTISTASWMY